jgi:hypothetical protein
VDGCSLDLWRVTSRREPNTSPNKTTFLSARLIRGRTAATKKNKEEILRTDPSSWTILCPCQALWLLVLSSHQVSSHQVFGSTQSLSSQVLQATIQRSAIQSNPIYVHDDDRRYRPDHRRELDPHVAIHNAGLGVKSLDVDPKYDDDEEEPPVTAGSRHRQEQQQPAIDDDDEAVDDDRPVHDVFSLRGIIRLVRM